MSIKNPLPGHQYGRSEPGYWYPRDDAPRRPPRLRRSARRQRQVVGWLFAALVIVVWVEVSHAHTVAGAVGRSSLPTSYFSPPAAPTFVSPGSTSSATAPSGYPDARVGDHVASAAGEVAVDGIEVTASGWTRMSIDGGQKAVCMTTSMVNRTSGEIEYGPADWSLQSPTGDVHPSVAVLYDLGSPPGQAPALESGQLIPGGTTSGRVCFDDPSVAGDYVTAYRPDLTGGERGIWLFKE